MTDYRKLLERSVLRIRELESRLEQHQHAQREPAAIIGMACRFPGGASSPEAFWRLLEEGRDAITAGGEARWHLTGSDLEGLEDGLRQPARWGGFLEQVESFDAAFFGVSPAEAAAMDPQQRLALELAWEGLEHAGLPASRLAGSRTGVFMGVWSHDYEHHLSAAMSGKWGPYAAPGTMTASVAGRISYTLGLEGPSLSVDTACSSSLVAVYLALQSLRNGECDVAIAGGVNLMLNPAVSLQMAEMQALSPDGRCRSFDARANGYVRGEGGGVVVLKRLEDARRDGDRLAAILRGSAVTHDGAAAGLTVPNPTAQAAMLRRALADAEIAPEQVGLIETHGTGTPMGDPAEYEALREVFATSPGNGQRCVLGAVKTNLGHLESAAGMAGLIKAVLCLQREVIPRNLHFETLNPRIDLTGTPFVIPAESLPWPCGEHPLLAGVSSFGMSGTNAHVVLERAIASEPQPETVADRPHHVLVLSARSEQALEDQAVNLASHLDRHPHLALRDVTHTAAVGRTPFDVRRAVIGSSRQAMVEAVVAPGGLRGRSHAGKLAFLFGSDPGVDAAAIETLRATSPVFRQAFDRCASADVGAPLPFALQFGLATLWQDWGIEPDVVVGYGAGEIAAACVAGALRPEDGARLWTARERMRSQLAEHSAAILLRASEDHVTQGLGELSAGAHLAAVLDRETIVVAGERGAVEACREAFAAQGVATKNLPGAGALHTPRVESVLDDFAQLLERLELQPPRTTMTPAARGDAESWLRQIQQPIDLPRALEAAVEASCDSFVEIGPGNGLAGLAACVLDGLPEARFVASLQADGGPWESLLGTLGQLWVRGIEVDWDRFDRPYARQKVALPTYPFERRRYWVEPLERVTETDSTATLDRLLYEIEWQPAEAEPDAGPSADGHWCLFVDGNGAGLALAASLRDAGATVTTVRPGESLELDGDEGWRLDPRSRAQTEELLDRLPKALAGVVHLWSLDVQEGSAHFDQARQLGCQSTLHLIQALARRPGEAAGRLHVVTRGAQPVIGDTSGDGPASQPVHAAQSPVWGLGLVAGLEHPELWGGALDLDPALDSVSQAHWLRARLLAPGDERQQAHRNGRSYAARMVRGDPLGNARMPPPDPHATYLVTGGVGGLGLRCASWLVAEGARRLVLTSRRGVTSGDQASAIADLTARGADIQVVRADAADREAMQAVLDGIDATASPLRGVIHAAGVLDPCSLQDLDDSALEAALSAKVQGGQHLDELTRQHSLEWLVLFSSGASMWGTAQGAHYAAANAYLDALAFARRGADLPTLSVNWGPWSGAGMGARQGDLDSEWMQATGQNPLQANDAFRLLGQLLGRGAVRAGVADIEWSRFQQVYEARGPRPLLARITAGATPTGAGPLTSLSQRLRDVSPARHEGEVLEIVRTVIAGVLGDADLARIDVDQPVRDLGFDSLMAVELRNRLQAALELPSGALPTTLAFDHPTARQMVTYLLGRLAGPSPKKPVTSRVTASDEPIAIVGMSCRFPGADDPESFWQLLRNGRDAIGPVPASRWDLESWHDPDPEAQGKIYAREGGFLPAVDHFDSELFGIAPREAAQMDPQQRLLLEVAWEAIESAGLSPTGLEGSDTSVFVGIISNDYGQRLLTNDARTIDAYTVTGTDTAVAAGRLSYVLGLRGPAMALNTACSSSLVAVHQACTSLRTGQSDLALAGGVNLLLSPSLYVGLSRFRALSPTDRCKAFSAAADGYVRSEGCGVVVLKRLSAAERDGDRILAVLRGSAVNQDGRSNGLTAPNGPAQEAVIGRALSQAGLEAHEVGYVECHGTGTPLGDPVELQALAASLGGGRPVDQPLRVGSVKSNIGHTEGAAGMAGLIKAVLILQNGAIPASLHFDAPNPHVDWQALPVRVQAKLRQWPRNGRQRVVGVSAFGFSGTNAHAIVSEAPDPPPEASSPESPPPDRSAHLLVLSAGSSETLDRQRSRLAGHLATSPEGSLADVCYTAATGRAQLGERLAAVAATRAGLEHRLAEGRVLRGQSQTRKVAWLFGGRLLGGRLLGAQLSGARLSGARLSGARNSIGSTSAKLAESSPVFRDALKRCGGSGEAAERFAFQYALATLWRSWGLHPHAVLGDGAGEIAAACAAGAFSPATGTRLAIARDRLEREVGKHSAAVVVRASEQQVAAWLSSLGAPAHIAAILSADSVIVAGSQDALDAVLTDLRHRGVPARRLEGAAALNTPLAGPQLGEEYQAFAAAVDALPVDALPVDRLSIPFLSSTDPRRTPDDALGAAYWRRQVRTPARFSDALDRALEAGCDSFVQIGPGASLVGLAARHLEGRDLCFAASLSTGDEPWTSLLGTLAQLWVRGVEVDWQGFEAPYRRRKVALPTYPFEPRRYPISPAPGPTPTATAGAVKTLPRGRYALAGAALELPGDAVHQIIPVGEGRRRYLSDHRVHGDIVVPGAFYVAVVIAVAAERFGATRATLRDVQFVRPWLLGDDTELHLILRPSSEREFRFTVSTRSEGPAAAGNWRDHAEGMLALDVSRQHSATAAVHRSEASTPYSIAAVYDQVLRSIEWGPRWRWLREVHTDRGAVFGHLSPADGIEGGKEGPLHPTLIDNSFAVGLTSCVIAAGEDPGEVPFLPWMIRELRWVRSAVDSAWCRSQIRDGASTPETATVDLTLFDASGAVLAEVEGLILKRAPRDAFLRLEASRSETSLFELRWAAETASPPHPPTAPSGRWLVVADGEWREAALREHWSDSGAELCLARRVESGTTWTGPTPTVDLSDRSQVDELVLRALASGPLDGAICWWGDTASTELDDTTADRAERRTVAALHIAQALIAGASGAPGTSSPRLWWVTEGAQSVGPGDSVDVSQAPIWGLGRVLMQEHPELRCTLVDLAPGDPERGAETLSAELARDDERQVAWRGGIRHYPRLLPTTDAPEMEEPATADRGTFLIVGGLGALGLHVARWLAREHGARQLVLASRREPDEDQLAAVERLRANGARVLIARLDVTDGEQVRELVTSLREPPLRGVVHAAGVLDDGVLIQHDAPRLSKVLEAKVRGAWNLHRATLDLPLEAFVLFSSASALLGGAGQGAYAAANAFLDGLAHLRRGLGMPAHSLNWGPWSDGGMADRLDDAQLARWRRQGIRRLTPELGVELLGRSLKHPQPQLAALVLDLPALDSNASSNISSNISSNALSSLWAALAKKTTSRPADPPASSAAAHWANLAPKALEKEIRTTVADEIATVLSLASDQILAPDRPLAEIGLDSLMAVELRNRLSARVGESLPATLAFDYPTAEALSRYLIDEALPRLEAPTVEVASTTTTGDEPIAIIGIGCRFPGGVHDPESFWRLLHRGEDAIREVPPERWDIDAYYDPDPDAPGKMLTRNGGFLAGIDQFDPDFFGISSPEATRMDPQQRLLLETSWEALQRAGIVPERLMGSDTGVFVGMMYHEYALLGGDAPEQLDGYTTIGNAGSIASGRISYVLGLKGPSLTVDTACSSSLVTLHLACQSLNRGECSLALAGGVTLILTPSVHIEFSRLRGLAPDGRCKTFGAAADGVAWSEGCGVLALKRLSDATRDGDPILAVVRGSAVNQDGRSNGLTAPNGPSQEAVIRRALAQAGVAPHAVGYVEAHGTGTPLGDPIEVQALAAVLGEGRPASRPLVMGSVKSNFGHTQAAAGVAGVIKAVLSLQHDEIPRSLHCSEPNPRIPWAELAVRAAVQEVPWPTNGSPRIAGVSSFGISGTNAHVVLEEAPRQAPSEQKSEQQAAPETPVVLPISAREPSALAAGAEQLRNWLARQEASSAASLTEVAHTASLRRSHYERRLAIVSASREEALDALDAVVRGELPPGVVQGEALPTEPRVVFVFPGQGSQWLGMGRELLEEEPAFRRTLEAWETAIEAETGWSLLGELQADEAHSKLDQIDVAQPVLLAVEVALANLWRSWGVEPDAVIGHSMGEVAAAHIAGALSHRDAARIICRRSRLLRRVSGQGVMALVELTRADAEAAVRGFEDRLSVAVSNSPRSTVLSGEPKAMETVLERLERENVFCRRVKVDVASHSPQMDPLRDDLQAALQELTPKPAAVDMVSTVTGQLNEGNELDAEYWVRNLRSPVLFSDVVQQLLRDGPTVFVEMSPHPILVPAIEEVTREGDAALPSLRRRQEERRSLLESLASMWTLGAPVDWQRLVPPGRCVDLPTYPWQRRRYWTSDTETPRRRTNLLPEGHPLLGAPLPVAVPATRIWEQVLSTETLAYLSDHSVQGHPVLPAAAYVEMASTAAAESFGEARHLLREIIFEQLLIVPSRDALIVQTVLTESASGATFQVASRLEAEATWTRHATGRLHMAEPAEPPADESLATIRARCSRTGRIDQHYRDAEARGIRYGVSFQGLRELSSGDREALGRIQLPEHLDDDAYRLHPALLDACLQVVGGLLASKGNAGGDNAGGDNDSDDRAYVPIGVDRIVWHRQPGRALWAHARIHRQAAEDTGEVDSDLLLLDDDGHVCLEFRGLRAARLSSDAIVSRDPLRDWLYGVEWQRLADLSALAAPASATDAAWLLLADRHGAGSHLAELLQGRGEPCVCAAAGDGYARSDEDHYVLDPTDPAAYRALLRDAFATRECRGVVHAWSLDALPIHSTTPETLTSAQDLGSLSVLFLAQAFLAPTWEDPAPRLWILTRGALSVHGESCLGVASATVWGLTRTLALEHPEFASTLVDLDPAAPAKEAGELLPIVVAPDREDQMALRRGERYGPRLARRDLLDEDAQPMRFEQEGSYLITGGLGGLGLEVARWMVTRGARHLALAGRSRPPAATQEAIAELEAAGATVVVLAADVAREEQVFAMLEAIDERLPRLRGIFHAAGVLDDSTVAELDREKVLAVAAPKVLGAWNLHSSTLDRDLDHFVMFSSAASLLGSEGQANYAAANAFLDALAQARRAESRPALSINWGAWAQVGLAAAQANRGDRLTHRGIGSISPDDGVKVLGRLLERAQRIPDDAQLGVIDIRWPAFVRAHPGAREAPLLRELIRSEVPSAGPQSQDLLTTLGTSTEEVRRQQMDVYLREQTARVLRVPTERLRPEHQPRDLGLDSLMALQLRNRIEHDLTIKVPTTRFLSRVSLGDLTAEMVEMLNLDPAPSTEAAAADSGAQEAARLPMSYGQRALWFIHRSAPDSPAYNVAFAARLGPGVDVEELGRAFRHLIARHASLRTTYGERDGEPFQRLDDGQGIVLEPLDIGSASSDQLTRLLGELAAHPFDLESAPPIRAQLLKPRAAAPVLLLTIHHIAIDMWSLQILLEDLGQLYSAHRRGTPATLTPVEGSYADFVDWQSKTLSGNEGEELWAYWRAQLGGELPALNLPADHPRPPEQTFRGAEAEFTLHRDLTTQLRALAKNEGTTEYTLLLAVLLTLLHRNTGQDDILVGTPAAGRGREDFSPVVGYFVNPVVVRGDCSGDPRFRDFLQQIHAKALGAIEHQDYPFPLLVEQLAPIRDPSRSPIFQVMFVLQRAHILKQGAEALRGGDAQLTLGDLELEPLTVPHPSSQFDVTWQMLEADGALTGILQYSTDLFEAATIERLLGHFERLLEGAMRQPDQTLSRLPMLRQSERTQLLTTWTDTAADFPSGKLIHQLVEEQVERTPNAVAANFRGERWSYRAVNRRANQLGHFLRGRGVRSGVLVGLCVERSFEMVVSMLGILKAGGAFVAIDPRYPRDRIQLMLEDAQPQVVLTLAAIADSLPPTDAEIFPLDTEGSEIDAAATDNPRAIHHPQDLAYIIYTSGSTGRPKGIAMAHRPFVNMLAWHLRSYPPGDAKTLQFASVGFDISSMETFSTWMVGGELVLIPNEVRWDSSRLLTVLIDEAIERAYFPPVALHHLAAAARAEDRAPKTLRALFAAGEQLVVTHTLKAFARQLEGAVVQNHYGPSEAHVITSHTLPSEPDLGPVRIGKPIDNLRIFLLDAQGGLVPVGVPGELYVGGVALARGYLNRPELTAVPFAPDPFANEPGARLYRTGDLCRWLADGSLEFLGRVDHQVKIRGFRIELGEIESVLTQHSGVRQAVALAREDSPGDRRLVAYYVGLESDPTLESHPAPEPKELREHLRTQLPDYMIPAALVPIDALPLTTNGKVDRGALPPPDLSDRETEILAPRTPIEEELAAIWAAVLGLERVGVTEDFFALGGHSLLATQVLSRIRTRFGIDVPMRAMFEEATVANLATRVESTHQATAPLTAGERPEKLPLSFAQERLWFLDQLDPLASSYNLPIAIHLRGPLDEDTLTASLLALARRHEALRTTFEARGGEPQQVISETASWPLTVVDLRQLGRSDEIADEPGDPRPTTVQIELDRVLGTVAHRPFDLEVGPCVRATLVRRGMRDHILLLNLHHIVCDGWSIDVVMRELAALYTARRDGNPPRLEALPIQFADFALWQRNWLAGEVTRSQLAYWRTQLAGASEALELPLDRPRPQRQTYRGAAHPIRLSRELSQAIGSLCQEENVTPFMVLSAAFFALLHRYTDQDDICLGSPIAGRTRAETEGLIGFFVNTLVLRGELSGRPSFRQLTRRIRDVALGAFSHQDLPFDRLVEELAPQRDLTRSPLFQAMFALDGELQAPEPTGGLSWKPIELENKTAKFDLTLALVDGTEGFRGELEFNIDLFDPRTTRRMAEHFNQLTTGMVSRPDHPVSEISWLTEGERRQLLEDSNGPREPLPENPWIHQLIADQVRRTPDAVAISCDGGQLTYHQLERRSRKLARVLRRSGVDRDARVAICAERSLDMVIGLVAILEAGGAYVPLDPEGPLDRLRFIVEDAAPVVTLTSAKLQNARQIHPCLRELSVEVIEIDAPWITPEDPAEATPSHDVAPQNLAYVLYTSGSTGRPKGVEIDHRSVANFLHCRRSTYGLGAADTVLHKTPLTFDPSVWEIFMPLTCGARVVLARPGGHRDPQYLLETIEREKVTLLDSVPSMLNVLVDLLTPDRIPSLRRILCGGEVLPPDLARRFHAVSQAELLNLYGPTETTVDVTADQTQGDDGSMTIGRPLANVRSYVRDASGELAPVGVVGELSIGGEQIARGYLSRSALTAAAFEPDPFSATPGARAYRTGDQARWRHDGRLDYLGRIDQQIKIRGHRVELAEIEAVLNRHPAVSEAAVVAHETLPGDLRLVAYVVPVDPEGSSCTDDLSELLHSALPAYMIPSTIVELAEMPRTSGGKLDRRALPEPEWTSARASPEGEPRDATERELGRIFAELLGVEAVDRGSDFFTLGGHSLLAVRLMALIQERLGRSLPLATLFQGATVANLAARLREAGRHREWSPLVPIQTGGAGQPFFWVHPVGGEVLCYAELARQLGSERPIFGLRARGVDGDQAPFASIEDMASHYLEAMLDTQPEGPYLLAGWSFGGLVAFEMATRLQDAGHPIALVALLDTVAPQHFARLPRSANGTGDLIGVAEALGAPIPSSELYRLSDEEQRQRLLAWLAEATGLSSDSGMSQLKRLVRVYRANVEATRHYRPATYPGRVVLLRAEDTSRVNPSGETPAFLSDPSLGWSEHAQKVEVHEVPGDHDSMVRTPHVETLTRVLRGYLQPDDADPSLGG